MLVDTSVWVEHLRRGDAKLSALLGRGEVECHAFIIGELACGWMQRRSEVLSLMRSLPHVIVAADDEVLTFVERHRLMGCGIGWVDAHLLASAALSRTSLWSRDRRLSQVAAELELGVEP